MIGRKKKRNKKEKSVGKEHQRGEHHNSTLSVGLGQQHRELHISTLIRLDWSINTDKHSKLCRAMEGAFCHDKSTN